MLTKEVLVGNIHEHYDNSYAELVLLACNFSSEIHLQTGSVKVNAKSIMGIIAFDTAENTPVSIIADGSDAEEAVAALEKYLTCK